MKHKPGREMPGVLPEPGSRRAPLRPRHAHMADQQHLGARSPPPQAQQKISGHLTSADVTQNHLDIRGYIDTARKHGPGAPEVLEQFMLGHPWMPPAQPISP
jgi:hypothetical protein